MWLKSSHFVSPSEINSAWFAAENVSALGVLRHQCSKRWIIDPRALFFAPAPPTESIAEPGHLGPVKTQIRTGRIHWLCSQPFDASRLHVIPREWWMNELAVTSDSFCHQTLQLAKLELLQNVIGTHLLLSTCQSVLHQATMNTKLPSKSILSESSLMV